ncbi:MAG: tetratricopeptide repeat protein [Candidatus Kariarchaeaceae archaeon]
MSSLLDDFDWQLKEANNYFEMGMRNRVIELLNILLEEMETETELQVKRTKEFLLIKLEASYFLAKTYMLIDNIPKAKKHFDSLLKMTVRTKLSNKGNALYFLGNGLLEMRTKTNDALEKLKTAASLFEIEVEPDYNKLGSVCNGIFICNILKGNVPEAKKSCLRAIEIFEKEKNNYDLSLSYINLGVMYSTLGENNEAIKCYKKAFKIQVQLNNNYLISMTLNNLGICYSIKGDLHKALDNYTKSLDLKRKCEANITSISNTLNNIAGIKVELGLFDEAYEIYKEALDVFITINEPLSLALSYHEIGRLERWRGNLSESIIMLKTAINFLEDLDNELELAYALAELVFSLVDLKETEEAKSYLEMIYQIQKKSQLPIINMHFEYANGYYLNSINQTQEAVEAFRRSEREAIALENLNYNTLNKLRLAEVLVNKYHLEKNEKLLIEAEAKLQTVYSIAQKNNYRVTQIEALVLRGKILLLEKKITAAKEIFAIVEQRAKIFGFKVTNELQTVSIKDIKTQEHIYSSNGLTEIRKEISEMLTPEEVHTAILENVLELNIPWPSKQNILFTCVKDIYLISSAVKRWKDQKLISEKDYNYLSELMAEKNNDIII